MSKKTDKPRTDALGLKSWAIRLGLASVGGCGVFLSFPTFDLWFLAWFALVPIFWAVRGTTAKQHFLIGLWAGFVTNLGGFHWMGGMLMDFGHMSFVLATALTLLMAVYQGLVFALWLLLLNKLRRWSKYGLWLLAPASYVTAESLIWFIFPWFYANSQYLAIPVIQICELGGVYLLSFLLVMTNAALFDFLTVLLEDRKVAKRSLAIVFAVPLLLCTYGLIRMHMIDGQVDAAPKLKIGLVEADVGIWEKEDRKKIDDNLVRHQRMSIELERKGADLIVWPETSYHAPFVLAQVAGKDELRRYRFIPRDAVFIPQSSSPPPEHAVEDRRARTPMRDRVLPQRGFKTPLLFGALTSRRNPESHSVKHPGVDHFNTAILLDHQGNVLGAFDKVYLLVFGEHIPLGETFPVFYEWVPEAGDLIPGKQVNVIEFGDYRLGIMVCYEDIIPAFSREIAALKPNILINVTNDAWFGKTAEPYLHLALAIFRTVETRLPLIRSTNTGVSCFVDPTGRILSETKLEDAETLMEELPMMDGGTLYQMLGDWPAYLSWLFMLVVFVNWRRSRSSKA